MDISWKDSLSQALRGAAKIAILGVGNPAKGDDGAGPRCVERMKRRMPPPAGERMLLIDAGEVPEHFTGALRRFGPDLTVIIDAAVSGRPPGTIFIVGRDEIADDAVSTHRISLRYLVRYVEETIGGAVWILGIQPKSVHDTAGQKALSPPVEKAARDIADFILEAAKPSDPE